MATASPCCSVCQMDVISGWCLGCWRSLDEIARWGSADAAYQRAVLQATELRREKSELVDRLL
ncbi:MAG: DUF1289 domain-containing protein [Herbaspirillum sp.]